MAQGSVLMTLLSLARDNKVPEIKALVAQGVPVNLSNQIGQAALHIAALWGNLEAIKALVDLGANVNVSNARGSTPLHFAAGAKANTLAVCRLLLSLGADPDNLDMMGRAPYELAASDDVRVLLGGPDPRIFDYAKAGNAAGLRGLLSSGSASDEGKVSVRVVDSKGRTPLNLAVAAQNLETVQVVLTHDRNVLDMPDTAGDTALHVAAGVGNIDIIKYLLSLKPETLDAQNMDSSEYSAGNWMLNGEVVEPLDKTPLAVAVSVGDVEAAKLMLEAGAFVDCIDFEKRTPLLTALEDLDVEMAELLLEYGANPNTPSQDFVSGLHLLAQRGPVELIPLLVSKGAKVNTPSTEGGWTPLHLAARSGKLDKAQALLAAGADVTVANTQGNTALHLASVNGHVPLVQLLIKQGAKVDVVNKDGKKPVDMAKNDATRAAFS